MLSHALTLPAVALVLVANFAATAQAVPASIPTPLVAALLESGYSATRPSSRFYVGELPAGFPASLVPPGPVYVVGGMTNGDQIVVVLADSTRRLAAVVEQMLEESGWSRPAPTPEFGFSSPSGPYSYFCRDSATVSAEPLNGAERSFIRVTYRRGRGRSSCSSAAPPPSRQQLTLPALMPPKDVQAITAGGGSGIGDVHSRAQLVGNKLESSAIVAHYTAQLVSAGWTAAAPAVGDRITAQRLEARDASGALWEGALVAVSRGDGVEITLSMQPRKNQ